MHQVYLYFAHEELALHVFIQALLPQWLQLCLSVCLAAPVSLMAVVEEAA